MTSAADPALDLAARIEHTRLDPAATERDLERLCEEAVTHGFVAVCVNPWGVSRCARVLAGTAVRVCSVADFPLGAGRTETRALEARLAVERGASEVDLVLPLGAFLSGALAEVSADLRAVRAAIGPGSLKVILETGRLSVEQIVTAARMSEEAGAAFVKTSTGFGPRGATPDDVALLRASVGPEVGVKASGAIRTLEQALALVHAGATRLGTSAGPAIVGRGSRA
jgi:deoxyribose-phosphate aldolase